MKSEDLFDSMAQDFQQGGPLDSMRNLEHYLPDAGSGRGGNGGGEFEGKVRSGGADNEDYESEGHEGGSGGNNRYCSVLNNRTLRLFGTFAQTKFHFILKSTALVLLGSNFNRMSNF